MLDILMLTLYLMNSNHFPSLLFFSFKLFLICLLPSLVGLLKAGFLISGLCLLFRWASWCNCGCSINSPVGRVFFCFRDSLSMSILVMFSLVGWYSWVMSSSSFSYSVSMFCVEIVAGRSESFTFIAFVTWIVRTNASSFIWVEIDIWTSFIMSIWSSTIIFWLYYASRYFWGVYWSRVSPLTIIPPLLCVPPLLISPLSLITERPLAGVVLPRLLLI